MKTLIRYILGLATPALCLAYTFAFPDAFGGSFRLLLITQLTTIAFIAVVLWAAEYGRTSDP